MRYDQWERDAQHAIAQQWVSMAVPPSEVAALVVDLRNAYQRVDALEAEQRDVEANCKVLREANSIQLQAVRDYEHRIAELETTAKSCKAELRDAWKAAEDYNEVINELAAKLRAREESTTPDYDAVEHEASADALAALMVGDEAAAESHARRAREAREHIPSFGMPRPKLGAAHARICELEAVARAREDQLAEMRERIESLESASESGYDHEALVADERLDEVIDILDEFEIPKWEAAPLLGHDDGAPLPEPRP